MSKSFFPTSDPAILIWAMNYKEKIGIHGAALGMTPVEVASEQALCDQIIDSITLIDSRKKQLKSALDGRDSAIEVQGGELRGNIANHKTVSGYTSNIGEDLGVISQSAAADFENFKSKITVTHFGGVIRVKFVKKGTDGINLYRRKKGSMDWSLVGRMTKSPFNYSYSLAVSGQPEHWEFFAFGVVNDEEVGLASDIVEVIYS